LAACTTPGSPVGSATSAKSAAPAGALAAMRREDVVWLQRLTFGLDSRTVGDYRRLGRERYLDQQLHPRDEALPEPVAAQLRALGPHALGRFRDLVLATLEHPAMLEYLDNAQNAVGHVNENYARELMELHTLGVDGGYGQQDVQQLARVLTGVGIDTAAAPHLRRESQGLYVRHGAFEFNPARHDFGAKMLLGQRI